jgi:hypothetical protein
MSSHDPDLEWWSVYLDGVKVFEDSSEADARAFYERAKAEVSGDERRSCSLYRGNSFTACDYFGSFFSGLPG